MTESLHARIAAVIRTGAPAIDWCQECGGFSDKPSGSREKWIEHLADTVVAELDTALLDFGLWLSEELRGWRMNRRDLESALEDWKAADE